MSPSTSVPAAVNVTVRGAVPDVGSADAVTTGASLTAFTVIETVAVFEFAVPSLARNVKESLPL